MKASSTVEQYSELAPVKPSRRRIHLPVYPHLPPRAPKVDRKISMRKSVPSQEYILDAITFGFPISQIKKELIAHKISSVKIGFRHPLSNHKCLWSIKLILDNGEWISIEPLWTVSRNGRISLKGLFPLLSTELRRHMKSNQFSQTNRHKFW